MTHDTTRHPSPRSADTDAADTASANGSAAPLRLLVVGSAGHVGSIVRPTLERQHHVRHLDLSPIPGAEQRTVLGSVTDADVVQRAVEGMDAVVYLAMGSFDPPVYVQSMFDVNVQGAYRVLHAALEAGVRRFIYASSISVYHARRRPRPLHESHVPDAWDAYGLSKRLGERVCEIASANYPGATITALRLVHPLNEQEQTDRLAAGDGYRKPYALGPEDTRRLFLAALALDKPGLHIVHTSGDLTGKRYSNEAAHALLGWQPRGE